MENVAPDGGDCCSNLSDSSGGVGGGRLQSLQENNSTTSQQQQLSPTKQQQLSPIKQQQLSSTKQQQMSPAKQQATVDVVQAVLVTPSSPASSTVLSERPTVDQQQHQQQLSKTLPRVNNSAGQDFKRSSRTPRTQSDPSNMPNKVDTTIASLQIMMMPPSQHSESVSSLQKCSQSDLSQVGSTESGYSSLSLNAPSPSHSPTRLSSGEFAGVGPLLHHSTTTTISSSATSTTNNTAGDLDDCISTWRSVEPPVTAPALPSHQYHHSVSRSCSVVSSDAASQTDVKSDTSTPLAVRRKSPEEIECEELSRDLISHLSPSDKLHNILGE